MWLRGVSVEEIKDAIIKGKKTKQETGLTEAFYRFFSVVYDEILLKNNNKYDIRKIYPVTVKLW
jgi:hypothetical protein